MKLIFFIKHQKKLLLLYYPYREEKSLRHVAMIAKFLDDNKPIKSPEKSIPTISNFTDLIQFHLIWQILAKFSFGGRYLSLEKEGDNFVLCSPTP